MSFPTKRMNRTKQFAHQYPIEDDERQQRHISLNTGCSKAKAREYAKAVKFYLNNVYLRDSRGFMRYRKDCSIYKFIEAAPKWHGGDTYRGVTGGKEDYDKTMVGDTINMRGVSSWSSYIEDTLYFSYGLVYVCQSAQYMGTSVSFAAELEYLVYEVIAHRKSRYRVVAKEILPNNLKRSQVLDDLKLPRYEGKYLYVVYVVETTAAPICLKVKGWLLGLPRYAYKTFYQRLLVMIADNSNHKLKQCKRLFRWIKRRFLYHITSEP